MAQGVLLTNKCLKSLELMAQSLCKIEKNTKDLSSYLGSAMNLNVESLLTLNVESQHVVTHFRKETSSLYENGSSIKEGVRESHHGVHVITHIPTHTTLLKLLLLASWSVVKFPNRLEKD